MSSVQRMEVSTILCLFVCLLDYRVHSTLLYEFNKLVRVTMLYELKVFIFQEWKKKFFLSWNRKSCFFFYTLKLIFQVERQFYLANACTDEKVQKHDKQVF